MDLPEQLQQLADRQTNDTNAIYERLEEQAVEMRSLKYHSAIRLKLLSAVSGLSVALGIALLSGISWEFKTEHQSFRFGLSADTIAQLLAVGIPSLGAGSAVAIAINKKVKE
ncbi:MAG: hypothetical protein H7Z11_01045 [Verrucomicrobia bacterium]|nr:hypothetical protein [Leptolyngbya sp. ES-bin-22]